MTIFSEMLREMDRNTIRYMKDDMKEQIANALEETVETVLPLYEQAVQRME